MNLDQQVSTSSATVYDQTYTNFVDILLKQSADDFEKHKKCMYFVIYHLLFNISLLEVLEPSPNMILHYGIRYLF